MAHKIMSRVTSVHFDSLLAFSKQCLKSFVCGLMWNAKMPRLTNIQRAMVVGQFQAGVPTNVITNTFNVHKSTVSRLLRKFHATGDVKDLPKPGRPRVTTRQEDNFIRLGVVRNRKLTGNQVCLYYCGHFMMHVDLYNGG